MLQMLDAGESHGGREPLERVQGGSAKRDQEGKMRHSMKRHKWARSSLATNTSWLSIFVISTCVFISTAALASAQATQRASAIESQTARTRSRREERQYVRSSGGNNNNNRDISSEDARQLRSRRHGERHSEGQPQQLGPTYYDFVKTSEPKDGRLLGRANFSKPAKKNATQSTSGAGLATKRKPAANAHRRTRKGQARGVKNETLDDEIETMDALIQVLDLANKRLLEEKRKKKRLDEGASYSTSGMDFSVTSAGKLSPDSTPGLVSLNKRSRPAGAEQQRADSSSPVRVEKTTQGTELVGENKVNSKSEPESDPKASSEDETKAPASKTKKKKKRKFKTKNRDRMAPYNATLPVATLEPIMHRTVLPASENETLTNQTTLSDSSSTTGDHNLVRPGFGSSPSQMEDRLNKNTTTTTTRNGRDQTAMSQNYLPHYQNQLATLNPLGMILPTVSPHDQQGAHGPHLMLQGHRPIVAHDLLDVRPQQQHLPQRSSQYYEIPPQHQLHPHHEDEEDRGLRVANKQQQQQPTPESIFGPYHLPRPLYESSHPHEGNQAGQHHHRPEPRPHTQRHPNPLLTFGPYQVYDPYSTTTQRPYEGVPGNSIEIDPSHESRGPAARPAPSGPPQLGMDRPADDWTPVVGSHLPAQQQGKPYRGEVVEIESPPTEPRRPSSNEQRELNNRFGDSTLGGAGGGGVPAPILFANPLQQLLEAARNQQAAALAQERGRLNYELELRKREDEMRRQHEANLERQHAAARERAAAEAAAQQKQQQQQQQGANDQSSQGDANQQQDGQQGAQQDPQQQPNANENESGQEGNGAAGEEQPSGDNEQGQEQPQDEQQNEQNGQNNNNQPAQDDPDMKNFQNFAGDTDFTDLFPPGILSQAEIAEMRKQQEEQKQRQEQEEEKEEREKQDQNQNSGGQEGEEEQQPQQVAAGGAEQEQQQRPGEEQQPAQAEGDQNASQNLQTNSTAEPNSGQHTVKAEVTRVNGSQALTSSSPNGPQVVAPPTIAGLPSYLFNNLSAGVVVPQVNQTGAQKTRRSFDQSPNGRRLATQPLMVLDSEYHDRYMRPFLSSLTAMQQQQQPRPAPPDRVLQPIAQHQGPPAEPTTWRRQDVMKASPAERDADKLAPEDNRLVRPHLIDFDDLLESYYQPVSRK